MKHNSSRNQEIKGQIVNRDVIQNVSILVSELSGVARYQDELWPVLSQYEQSKDGEDIEREAYEHWVVSDWLADKLEAHGEMIIKDFLGLTIWGRATTGQAILLDHVISVICENMEILEGQVNEWK